MNIPVTRLMSTEKEKLLRTKRILADSVVGQPEQGDCQRDSTPLMP